MDTVVPCCRHVTTQHYCPDVPDVFSLPGRNMWVEDIMDHSKPLADAMEQFSDGASSVDLTASLVLRDKVNKNKTQIFSFDSTGPCEDDVGLYKVTRKEGLLPLISIKSHTKKSILKAKSFIQTDAVGMMWRCLGSRKPYVYEELFHVCELDKESAKGKVYGLVTSHNRKHVEGWALLYDESSSERFALRVSMLEQIQITLEKPLYDVKKLYKLAGLWPKIAKSQLFDQGTLVVIILNALWLWVDADYNNATSLIDSAPLFQTVEHLFSIYFSFEWLVRLMSFKRKLEGFHDAWFAFDTCLVAAMVFENWFMSAWLLASGTQNFNGTGGATSLLRMLRLLRLTRLTRMLRSFPELMIMVKGIAAATRSVVLTITLLLMLMSVTAVLFRQLTKDTKLKESLFTNVGGSMYVLLMSGTFLEDVKATTDLLGAENHLYLLVFMIFILLSALTVLNMLIGILCEVVSGVAQVEKEQMMLEFVHSRMQAAMTQIDVDGDNRVSKTEFMKILQNPQAVHSLLEIGVDPWTLLEYRDFIFETDDGQDIDLSFEKFLSLVVSLRSTNMATVRDTADVRKYVIKSFDRIEGALRQKVENYHLTTERALRNTRSIINTADVAKLREANRDLLNGFERLDAFFTVITTDVSSFVTTLPSEWPPEDRQDCKRLQQSVSAYAKRTERFANQIWGELQKLNPSERSDPEANDIKIWRALTEDMLLSTYVGCLETLRRLEHSDLTTSLLIFEIKTCVLGFASEASEKHMGLQNLVNIILDDDSSSDSCCVFEA